MKTIHETAVFLYGLRASTLEDRFKTAPCWLRAKMIRDMKKAARKRCARKAVQEAPKRATAALHRDYRGWLRTGGRVGPGSGRSAEWLDIAFEHLCVIAKAVHATTGLRDGDCREVARAILRWRLGQAKIPKATPEHPLGIAWETWARSTGARAIGEYDAKALLGRLASDPNYRISGYLAASIMAWREGRDGYENCSGCESYHIHRENPDSWDALMARAPEGATVRDEAGEVSAEQVYPHEVRKREQLVALGWRETFRLNDSVWTPAT